MVYALIFVYTFWYGDAFDGVQRALTIDSFRTEANCVVALEDLESAIGDSRRADTEFQLFCLPVALKATATRNK